MPQCSARRWRDREPALAQLVGDPHLAEGGLLNRELDDRRLDLRGDPVLQHRLAPADLLQRQLAAFVVQLLEAVEAVARIAHHLAGLAYIPELLGELQQADLGADDLLFSGHDGVLSNRRDGALRHPDRSAPRLGCRCAVDQAATVRLSLS